MGRLPLAVAGAITAAGGEIRTGTPVRGLARRPGGWEVRTGGGALHADAVVVAVPAGAASELLAAECPAAAAELAAVEYASMALVTLAFRRADAACVPAGSGFLVPPVDGRAIKASTFSSRKWDWVDENAGDLFVLRTSSAGTARRSTSTGTTPTSSRSPCATSATPWGSPRSPSRPR